LLSDLEQRGLLDDTLVVWGGEFGRPGLTPDNGKDETDHNEKGFTFWLAGAGVKGGYAHGKTSPTGDRAVEGGVHFRDLHATILQALGLPPNDLTFWYAGRDHRLTGPEGGKFVKELFAGDLREASRKSDWRLSRTPAVRYAMPNKWLEQLGFLLAQAALMQPCDPIVAKTGGIAGCEPACQVAWEGPSAMAALTRFRFALCDSAAESFLGKAHCSSQVATERFTWQVDCHHHSGSDFEDKSSLDRP
jgi:hypothetical protein